MNIIFATLLGIIQGVTEFLPVSSSAHLAIAQSLIPGFTQPGLLFDVFLHMATTLAVLFYFRKLLLKLSLKDLVLLAISTVPAVIFGLLFRQILEGSFNDIKAIGWQLIITGLLNFLVISSVTKSKEIDLMDSIIIGIAQAIAIIPGISRSGATIFAGVKLGIDKKKVAEFSFLMSIPAIIGANMLEVVSHRSELGSFNISYIFGFIGALIIGFASIGVLMKIITEKRYAIFGFYCIILGIVTIIFLK